MFAKLASRSCSSVPHGYYSPVSALWEYVELYNTNNNQYNGETVMVNIKSNEKEFF